MKKLWNKTIGKIAMIGCGCLLVPFVLALIIFIGLCIFCLLAFGLPGNSQTVEPTSIVEETKSIPYEYGDVITENKTIGEFKMVDGVKITILERGIKTPTEQQECNSFNNSEYDSEYFIIEIVNNTDQEIYFNPAGFSAVMNTGYQATMNNIGDPMLCLNDTLNFTTVLPGATAYTSASLLVYDGDYIDSLYYSGDNIEFAIDLPEPIK